MMKSALSILLVAMALATVVATPRRAAASPACTVNYKGPMNDHWNVGGNWDSNNVPQPGDVACIPPGMGTITIDANVVAIVTDVVANSALHILANGILEVTDSTPGFPSSVTDITIDLNGVFESIALGGVSITGNASVIGFLTCSAELETGATLSGTGSTGALTNVGGTIRPGGANTVGTLKIGGAFTQQAGGTLELDIASDASFDTLNVPASPTTLGGTVKVNLLGSTPANNTMFLIISGGNATLSMGLDVMPSSFVPSTNGFSVTLTFTSGSTTTTTTTTHTTTTSTTTSITVTTTTQTTTTTTSRPPPTTTTLPSTAEVCGNCADDDGDGQTDFEDASCCPAGVTSVVLRKGKIHPLKGNASFMQLDTTISAPAGIDALKQDVEVQLRTADGKRTLLCAFVPASKFRKVRKTVTFSDRKHTVASAELVEGVELRPTKTGQLFVHIQGRRLGFAAPTETNLLLTLGFSDPKNPSGNRCAGGVQDFRAPKHKDLIFP